MGLFGKKLELHSIDGRTIIIKSYPIITEEQLNLSRKVILQFCRVDKGAKHFPKLTFVLKGAGPFGKADYHRTEIILNVLEIYSFYNKNLSEELNGILAHEVAHLWHELKAGILSSKKAYLSRVAEKEQ